MKNGVINEKWSDKAIKATIKMTIKMTIKTTINMAILVLQLTKRAATNSDSCLVFIVLIFCYIIGIYYGGSIYL